MNDDDKLAKGVRVTGTDRDVLRTRVADLYQTQPFPSVRTISELTGRSYGAVHRLLSEAGVEFRPRGNRSSR